MELLIAVYQTGGLDELILIGVLLLTFLLLRAYANRQNAESRQQLAEADAIETTSKIARDSSTNLQIAQELNQALNKENARLEREKEHAYALLTQSDNELKDCRIEKDSLIVQKNLTAQLLAEANEKIKQLSQKE